MTAEHCARRQRIIAVAALLSLTVGLPGRATAQDAAGPQIDNHVRVHVQSAIESSGEPGAPDSTTTIDGNYLPNAAEPFGGQIQLNAAESTPFWPARVVPPEGAPNILLIMTDDTGYGAASTFGGVIPTPTLDKLAAAGLRYTNFNSTALCSPTRAALLTGRNHHAVGFGNIAEASSG